MPTTTNIRSTALLSAIGCILVAVAAPYQTAVAFAPSTTSVVLRRPAATTTNINTRLYETPENFATVASTIADATGALAGQTIVVKYGGVRAFVCDFPYVITDSGIQL